MTKQKIDTVFVLIIFCVFAASVLVVLALGGSVYKNLTNLSREGENEQICLSYIWSKVKNADEKVYIGDFQDLSALCIDEEYDGVTYRTMIYQYDGWIRELFSEEGLEFSPEDGVPVIEAESLSMSQLENGLIKAESGSKSVLIFPRVQG